MIEEVLEKYPYLSEVDVGRIVEKAKFFYYSLLYPASPDVECEEELGMRAKMWVLSACDEIIERMGFSSAVGYRENGMNWTLDNAQISNFLASLIKPIVGVIK